MGISLDKFINNLEEVRDEGLVKICEKQIKDVFYTVLYEMAKLTIVDTGQARSAIIDDFASRYGYNVSELYSEFYGFWEKDRNLYAPWGNGRSELRNWGSADVSYSDKFDKRGANVDLNINDEGLFAQENATGNKFNGREYPSSTHAENTGRDNSKYEIRHITKVSDDWVNNSEINKLFKDIENEIVNRLFK